jgi:hypothetical protein
MSTNRGILRNPLQWNKFRIVFSVEVYTKELCYETIPPRRSQLRDLLLTLSDKGLSNREIADHLESQNIKSPQGKPYSVKLIWVTLKKWREREKRLKHRTLTMSPITIEWENDE